MGKSVVVFVVFGVLAIANSLPIHDEDHSPLFGDADLDVHSSSYLHGYYPYSLSNTHYGSGYLYNVLNKHGDYSHYGYQNYGYPHGPHYYGSYGSTHYGYPHHGYGSSHYYPGVHSYGHGYSHVY